MTLTCSIGHQITTGGFLDFYLEPGDPCPYSLCTLTLFNKDLRPEGCTHNLKIGDKVGWLEFRPHSHYSYQTFQVVKIFKSVVWIRLFYKGKLLALFRGVNPDRLTKLD